MILARSLAVFVVALLASLATFASAPGAHAQTQPWTAVPLDDFGLDPTELTRLRAMPLVPDLLEPLWDRAPQAQLVTNALGPPDRVDGSTQHWVFSPPRSPQGSTTLQLTVYQLSSVTMVEYASIQIPEPAPTRAFDSRGLPFAAVLDAMPSGCNAVMAVLGQPSFKDKRQFVWATANGDRDIGITLECDNDEVQALRFLQCEAAPKDLAALLASSTGPVRLPTRFKQVSPEPRTLDPRELWPRGFVPGDSVANLLQKVGPPSLLESSNGVVMRWAFAIGAVVTDGTLRVVTLSTPGLLVLARRGVTSPVVSLLGKPVAQLTEHLGRPIVRGSERTWRWTADGHELAIVGEVDGETVTQLSFIWVPAPRRDALACAALLAQKPSLAPKAGTFVSGDTSMSTTQLVPFKLWFGANHADVVKRLGTPLACDDEGNVLAFPGIELRFVEGRLVSVEVNVEFLSAEHYAQKDPLLAALRQGAQETNSYLGMQLYPRFTQALTGTFERGAQRIDVEVELGSLEVSPVSATTYRVASRPGFDFDLLTGLRFEALPAQGRAALGLPALPDVRPLFDGALVLRSADKPALKSKKIGGKLIELLGAPWSTVTTALGETTQVHVEGDTMTLVWEPEDPLERKLAFVCVGAKPLCNDLHLSGPTR